MYGVRTFNFSNITVIFGREIFICSCLCLCMHDVEWEENRNSGIYVVNECYLFIRNFFFHCNAQKRKKIFLLHFSGKLHANSYVPLPCLDGYVCEILHICDSFFPFWIPCALLPKAKNSIAVVVVVVVVVFQMNYSHSWASLAHLHTLTPSLSLFLSFFLPNFTHAQTYTLTHILSSKSDAKQLSTLLHCHITLLAYFLRSLYSMKLKSFKVTVGICWCRLSMLF